MSCSWSLRNAQSRDGDWAGHTQVAHIRHGSLIPYKEKLTLASGSHIAPCSEKRRVPAPAGFMQVFKLPAVLLSVFTDLQRTFNEKSLKLLHLRARISFHVWF